MKKQDLLKIINGELLDKLFGFCYARTRDSHEANELCSDIVYALVQSAGRDGDIESPYPFIWRVARNVYADFSKRRRQAAETYGELPSCDVPDESSNDDTGEMLCAVYRRIAYLTRAYREVMIMFYLDGLPVSDIARRQNTSETAVRQRLFSARQKLKSEVNEMAEYTNKPTMLDKIEYVIWGTGSPSWGDPRGGLSRQFSKHVMWLCHQKPRTAAEIAAELNVPTVYVEEELDILTRGENGKYGFLRKLDNGKYAMNIVLFDKDVFEAANAVYTERLPMICDAIADYIEANREKYLAFPYLNHRVDLNLILWQQIKSLSGVFGGKVAKILETEYFAGLECPDRPFSVFGYVDNGKEYGGGCDGADAENLCGYSYVNLTNIYIARIKQHFWCGHNISLDPQLQLAIRAINGLDVSELNEKEREAAAKAIGCGYLYREGDMLYTKILVADTKDEKKMFDISRGLSGDELTREAQKVAEKLAKIIRGTLPEYLLNEWRFANTLASLPIQDALVEELIRRGVLTPPEDGIGAEGCWMIVKK